MAPILSLIRCPGKQNFRLTGPNRRCENSGKVKSPDRDPNSPPVRLSLDAIISRLATLTYRERRVFLWKRVNPRLPRFLYKFRRLIPSDKRSIDHLRDIVVRSRFWLSSPADFNDPFDMAATFTVDASVLEKRKRLDTLLKSRGFNWKERKRHVTRWMAKEDDELAAVIQETYRAQIESTGVYSFAGDPRSILMWSHYASNHEGICLQFEVAEDPRTFTFAPPVEYSDQYPVMNWVKEKNLMKAALRKYSGWRYEKESRLIVLNKAHSFVSFRPEALKGIILGCRAKPETIERLIDLIEERSSAGFARPKLYRAVRHASEYKLIIKSLPG